MSNYYAKKEAKVNIAHQLMSKGWEVYGYSPDQSDSMTDYYCPASWDGIATKNGYVLVVDTYVQSGREIIEYTYNNSTNSNINYSSKIEKLSKMTVANGCTEAEAENAQAQIEKLKASQSESNVRNTVVVGRYPEFVATPKGSLWHIEKDGIIIAKGRALTTMASIPENWWFDFETETVKKGYSGSVSENQIKAIKALKSFIKKLESIVAVKVGEGDEEETLVKTVITETKTSKQLKEVTDRKTLKVGDVFKDNSGKNVQILEIEDTRILTVNLGTQKGGYKQSKAGGSVGYWRAESIKKSFENGRLKVYEIVEVTESFEVEKWVKNPAKKQTVKPQPQETKETACNVSEVETVETATEEIKVVYNEEKNGIELYFDGKPSEETREILKANGFRWSRYSKAWYVKDTAESREFIQAFTASDSQDNAQIQTVEEIADRIIIDDIDTYTIDAHLSKLENEGSWIFRTKERNHQDELQELYKSFLSRVCAVLPYLDVKNQIKLKRDFNYFKKHYHASYVKQLRIKANNPSWAVTGRSGRNISKYNQAMERLHVETGKGVKVYEEFKNRLENHEYRVNKRTA